MSTPRLPPLLKLLASIGIIFGALNALSATSIARLLLSDREEFIASFRDQAGQPAASPSPSPSPEPVVSPSPSPTPEPLFSMTPAEQAADRLFSLRGVILPLAAIALILSLLMLAGCLRTLRGSAWGLSAWTTACIAAIPFQFLNAASAIHEAGELPGVLILGWAISCGYCGVCVIYLRRAKIRALFR